MSEDSKKLSYTLYADHKPNQKNSKWTLKNSQIVFIINNSRIF